MVIIDNTSAWWLIELPCIALWQVISIVNLAISVILREGTSSEKLSTMGWSVGIPVRGFNWINWDYKTYTKCGQYSCMGWALAWIKRRKGAERTFPSSLLLDPGSYFTSSLEQLPLYFQAMVKSSHNPFSPKLILLEYFITVARRKKKKKDSHHILFPWKLWRLLNDTNTTTLSHT